MSRYIPPDTKLVERNGHVFIVDVGPFCRHFYDPVTAIGIGLMAVGTVQGMQATRQEGKDAENIAQQRAAIDIANAEATREAAVEEAKIRGERGRRFLATQKSQAAAGGIRINVGSPLVIEAETRDIITRDIGFVLETGRTESDFFRSSAALEIATGKTIKRQKKASAIAQGLRGFGSIALMAKDAGLFNKTPTGKVLPNQGIRRTERFSLA